MKLEQYFRLIVTTIFQPSIRNLMVSVIDNQKMSYNNQYFYCPRIVCKDGFSVSLQVNNGNYASSENGYSDFGLIWKELEFGFPSINEKEMFKYSAMYGYGGYDENGDEKAFDEESFDIINSVGRIPINVMQDICDKHGGIDWDKTVSIESCEKFLKL